MSLNWLYKTDTTWVFKLPCPSNAHKVKLCRWLIRMEPVFRNSYKPTLYIIDSRGVRK